MAPYIRIIGTAVVTLVLLNGASTLRGQDRKGALSPEVTAERRITFRLQAPNAKLVQVLGDFTTKTHDMTQDAS